MHCGALSPEHVKADELTLVDWIGSTKLQRRLSAGLWGADHPSRMRFPTDEKPYEPAAKPIILMPLHWYEKT